MNLAAGSAIPAARAPRQLGQLADHGSNCACRG